MSFDEEEESKRLSLYFWWCVTVIKSISGGYICQTFELFRCADKHIGEEERGLSFCSTLI